MPRITILMASFNGAAHLPAQLASIAAQTHDDWRLIVSDDGSTDSTLALIDAFAARYRAGQVLRRAGPQRGAVANFLTLVTDPEITTLTQGDMLAFCDQDDIWHPEKLAAAITYLAAAPAGRPALYGCRVNIIAQDGTFLREGPTRPRGASLQNALVQNIIGGHGAVMNAQGAALLRANTTPPFAAYHDWWLYLLFTAAGAEIYLDPTPRLDYRQHGANVLGTNHDLRAKLRRLRWLGSRDITRWIDENMIALDAARPALTQEAVAVIEQFKSLRGLKGVAAVRALRSLKLHRQSAVQSLALYWGAWRGQL